MKQHQKIEKKKIIKKNHYYWYVLCIFVFLHIRLTIGLFSWGAAVDIVFLHIRVLGTRVFGGILSRALCSIRGHSVRSTRPLLDPRAFGFRRIRGKCRHDMTWHDLLPKSGPQIWHKLLTPHFVQRLSLILKPKPKKNLEEKTRKRTELGSI